MQKKHAAFLLTEEDYAILDRIKAALAKERGEANRTDALKHAIRVAEEQMGLKKGKR